MDAVFGRMQEHMSERMRRHPRLARFISSVFGYTLVGNYARALTFNSLLEKLPTQTFRRVLDLGCGYGEYAFLMADMLPQARVTALDVNPAPLASIERLSREHALHNLETHHGPITDLEDREAYDFIFSIDVFEHIEASAMPFAAAYQKLKPGGYLLVKMPTREQLTILPERWFEDHHDWLEDEHIGQVYDLEGLRERMEREGFEIQYAAYGDGWLSRLAWELGYLSHQAGPVPQLLVLPVAKALVRLGRIFDRKDRGNTIQVIGRKPG